GLVVLEILLANEPAVFAGRDPYSGSVAVVRHHAVGAEIDPAGVGIAHDHAAIGADIAAAILLVDHRHRKLEQIDRLIAVDILDQRPIRHGHRRDEFEAPFHAV